MVIDPTINPSMMELYADPSATGGVLEPEAIVEIKYCAKDVRKTMERLDPVMRGLVEEMAASGVTAAQRAELDQRLKRREEQLAGVYHQVLNWTCISVLCLLADLSNCIGSSCVLVFQYCFSVQAVM